MKVNSPEVYICLVAINMADLSSDSSDEENALAIFVVLRESLRKQKRKRRWWVQPWLDRRERLGTFHTLSRELREESVDQYRFVRNFLRSELIIEFFLCVLY